MNYQNEAWILKLDIAGFFMSIDHSILLGMIERIIDTKYQGKDSETLRFLVRTVISNDPTKNCIIKGNPADWQGLPRNKSLFYAPKDTGLPIGNLTSQIFANLYLNELDTFIKKTLKIQHYGRYVDDFVLIHPDCDFLLSCIPKIEDFLKTELRLTLHPDKIIICSVQDGFSFLGTYIKPYRTYIGNRTKGNFLTTIEGWNEKIRQNGGKLALTERDTFLSSINSYLGIMKQFSTYRLRKKILTRNLSVYFWNEFYISSGYGKIVKKNKR